MSSVVGAGLSKNVSITHQLQPRKTSRPGYVIHKPVTVLLRTAKKITWSMTPKVSKSLFSLELCNLQLHCFLGLGTLFCCSFFCSFDQPCKML